MLNMIEMVVFDMAGTTVNEQNVVYKTLHKSINKHGVLVELDKVLEIGAGKEKFQAIKDILDYADMEQFINAEVIFEDFKVQLDNAYKHLNVLPIQGVEEVMMELISKDIIVVLNTGYNSKVANSLLEKLHWIKGIHYNLLVTADDVVNGRPNPDMIELAMKKFKIKDPSKVLKAGDSAIDIEEGKNAYCGVTVGVLSGAQTKEQIESMNPTYILDSLANLLSLDIF
ncbi:HAD hydrolase-like protein [Yeosuana marina]|uniref:HAD hydrolase-like protein n=1 Tax=Yeosuana marina TaxID=1565536 RepID=UPI0030EBBF6B|tara:strand:+ start:1443 stop:2123 length:681 start_codon:yes stop_codon:yes gene_type:complete